MNSKIKYIIMDVDGTLTDGKIYISNQGEAMKAFNVKDGYGIHDILPHYSITPVIITGRASRIVEKRCQELGIVFLFQNVRNKLNQISLFLKENHSNFENLAYIGDDISDLESMNYIAKNGGITGCPKDAIEKIKEASLFISKYNGGNGAVREFIEWITRG